MNSQLAMRVFQIFNQRLFRDSDTQQIRLYTNTFGLMNKSRKTSKTAYQGKIPLEKFAKFAETAEAQEAPAMTEPAADTNVGVPRPHLQCAIEEINISDDDDDDLTEKELDDEDAYAAEEQELNALIKRFTPTPKQGEAATEKTQHSVLKPPQSESATIDEPASSDQTDSGSDLEPRKRRKMAPDTTQATSTPIQPTSKVHTTQGPTTESIPMDQDFQAPTTSAAPETHAGGSSSTPPVLNILRGKSKLPHAEPVDIVQLQGRVFDLEQESATKDLIIVNLDVRNLGGLTALLYDLKQSLSQKFVDEFPSHGDTGASPNTGPSTQQTPHKFVTPPAPDENIENYLASGPPTAEERRKKQKKG
ncbi:hypothetical protein LXL04_034551 [Taraxacum kok-saghyz]